MTLPEPATAGFRSSQTEVGSVFVSNYPPFSAWGEEALPGVRRMLASPPADPEAPLGLYLHVPFCRKRCKFCYFKVYTDKNSDEIGRYTDALAEEAALYAALPALAGRRPGFVYFGGGTPSYISVRHLTGLVERLRGSFDWSGVEEITFECEPGTLTRSKLEAIRGIGVTRLSLGIESFDDEILAENGRAHLSREIARVKPWIDQLGFDQVNVDLIAGMVGETWESWRDTVEKTLDYDPDSVTIYQMELPFNARFSKELLNGRFARPLADWETKRAWHAYALDRLSEAGYEISSAYTLVRRRRGAKARFVYRDALWHGADLLGLGVSSFSHAGGFHFQNSSSWGEYLAAVAAGELPLARAFATGPTERLIREMILQLKLGRISAAPFLEKFGVDVLERFRPVWRGLESEDLLEIDGDRIELTRDGLLQVDALLPRFYEERYRGVRYT